MSKAIDIFDLFERLKKNEVLVSYHGDLNSNLITSLLHLVEEKMEHMNTDLKVKKRVFNVMVEALQNLYHHAEQVNGAMKRVAIAVAGKNDVFYVATGNLIDAKKADQLKDSIAKVSQMDQEELRDMYLHQLNNGALSSKGGAGLGIIDLARRAEGQLEYKFIETQEDQYFFTLNVKVNN